jgi:hypothetical protein
MTEDLVDCFYRDLVQPLGNLVILFAQAEASLVDLVADLDGSADQKNAQRVLKADNGKEQVLALARASGLIDYHLTDLLNGIEQYWADKESRNRYMHDEWFVIIRDGGIPSTRGVPLKKGATVVWDNPTADEVWALAERFRDHHHLFSDMAYFRRRDRPEPSDAERS